MIDVTFKGIDRLQRRIRAERQREKKALDTAVRVEAFRLTTQLKKEIRAGAPGNRRFAPLSVIARRLYHRGRNQPLYRLALAVRYHVADRDPLQVHIGWTGPRVSARWKRLAKMQQEGFTADVSESRRRFLAAYGAGLRNTRQARYFFLRKTTRSIKTPARPILDPFWAKHEGEVRQNITVNFRRKLAGHRI